MQAFIADFAAARQGDTGDPIVIDAAALEPAGQEAIDDPAAAVAELGEFPRYLQRDRTGPGQPDR